MIESITLRDFQKHRKRTFEFSPRITMLVGDTESGKSTVLRALRWVLLNRAEGRFIHWDAKSAKAILAVDKRTLTRRKGTSNTYQLDDQTFRAIGTRVPETVENLLNVSDLNFQGQLDGPFWFSLTPGQVSRELNDIINLGSIDAALASVGKQVRKAKLAVEVSRDRLKKAKQQRKELRWAVQTDKDLMELERLQQQRERLADRVERLETLTGKVKDAKRARNAAEKGSVLALEVVHAGSECRRASKRLSRLNELIGALSTATELAGKEPPDIGVLETIVERHQAVSKRYEKLDGLIARIETAKERLAWAEKQSKAATRTLRKASKGKCPVCGQAIPTPS